ncbi:peptide deformylase [Sulfitobacter guttiformis]|uniref:Peptide deformylase-like n=1 Tax=Sulfitobacter guttiformis TaxID=74349 RepID=A0A420DQS7_9RHOB|nr:peptide deformylase [Sulfitobacter guttiformis]KIN73966.1 Peptide deformylase [Sulfitobacter guttiformis KCTC 32187]RKE96592.1 peptide deformylase [Sulfitobacter guttiformis]
MTVRKILTWPDKRLRSSTEEVTEITDDVRAIWDDMIATMDAMPGVGLGAPQIGVMLKLAVVDTSEARNKRIRLANPEVIDASAIMNVHEEASPCLSGVSAKISRPRGVKVRYMDETGTLVERDFVGLDATSVQHQIDHLAGKMYFDRLSKTRRDMLIRRARKLNG